MIKLYKKISIICVLAMFTLGACMRNDVNGTTENVTNETTEAVTDGTTKEHLDNKIINREYILTDEQYLSAACFKSCDDRALAKVMKKAAGKEKVVIACIGGSITQGTISSGANDSALTSKKCYADLVFSWWKDTFPETEFEFVNAGIGGTDSYYGVHRVDEDVITYSPDLVIVEFSVNDADSIFYKKSYENLVRKILTNESDPAVMLLFMGQSNGASSVASHLPIGFNYKLPMVSYTSLINELINEGVYTEKELSGDTVHPSALGHAIAGEIITRYFDNVYLEYENYEAPDKFDISPLTKYVYENASVLHYEETVNDKIVFNETFRNLGILYLATIDGLSGQYDIYVDGEKVATINADFSGGWGNSVSAKEVYTSATSDEREILIKISPDSTGDILKLLGLLIS